MSLCRHRPNVSDTQTADSNKDAVIDEAGRIDIYTRKMPCATNLRYASKGNIPSLLPKNRESYGLATLHSIPHARCYSDNPQSFFTRTRTMNPW